MSTVADKDEVRARVTRGCDLLNKHMPEWKKSVQPELLDQSSPHACVLGQVFQDPWEELPAELRETCTPFEMGIQLMADYEQTIIKPSDFGWSADRSVEPEWAEQLTS